MKQIEELYYLYKKDIYVYLLSLTHNPFLTEDLLSETFVKAIGSVSNFKGESSIKTWLFSISRNLWLQSIRKEKHTVEYNDLLKIYATDTIEETVLSNEMIDMVKNILSTKDERTQRIVNMRLEGYSFEEIAEVVGISVESARVVDFRTKRWLKAILEREGLR